MIVNPYAGILMVSAAFSAVLAGLAWRRRPTPGAAILTLLMLALANWSLAYALEMVSTDLATKLFWTRVQYLSILTVPTLWLIFVLQFSERKHWLTTGRLAALAIVPLLTSVLIWASKAQSWLYRAAVIVADGSFALLKVTYGPLFWAQATYNYTVFLLATMLVLIAFLRGGALQRAQNGALLVGALAPLIGNALYVFRLSPVPNVDLTPLLFIVTGLASLWALLRYRFLDLMPVARDALIENMTDGVVVIDGQGRVVDLNLVAQRMLGQPANAILGAPAAAVLPGWAGQAPILRLDRMVQSQVMLDGNGALRYLDLRVSPLGQRHKTSNLRGWLAVYRDDTARVLAEHAELRQRSMADGLRDAAAALTDTLSLDEVLDRILEQTEAIVPHRLSNIMLIEDGQIHITRARGFEESRLETYLENLHLSIKDTANLRWMYETHQPLAISDTRSYPGWVNLIGVEWIRSYAGAPMISKGEVIGFLNLNSIEPGFFTQEHAEALQAFANQAGVAIENARLYASLQEVNTRLSRALQAREEAIQNVSHELRTPLTLMLGYVEFIESGRTGPLTTQQLDALRIIAQQGQRLEFIFNSLLTLQTIHENALQLEPVDLVSLLRAAVDAWRFLASDAGLAIELALPADLPTVMVAPSYMELVLGNLIDNAVKFSPEGAAIKISARVEDAVVVMAVADQGIGIAEDHLELIFTRFYQVDSTTTRPFRGMGIGLALCDAVIRAHGGRIWVKSAWPDQGSTFFVALPVANSQPA